MKVKMLRNPGFGYGCKLKEGQTGDVDDQIAEDMINHGLAIEVRATQRPKKVKGVSKEPEIAKAVSPEIAEFKEKETKE